MAARMVRENMERRQFKAMMEVLAMLSLDVVRLVETLRLGVRLAPSKSGILALGIWA